MDVIGVQAGCREGATPTTLSSPNNLEKGFYQILMNKMEMDFKDERFFMKNSTEHEWMS